MISLDYIPAGDWDGIERMRSKLRALVPDSGGITTDFRFGSGTISFAASTDSTVPCTVDHGLAKTPAAIFVINAAPQGFGAIASYTTGNVTATSFDVYARIPVAQTITLDFYWLVIG